jgi:hypothetical protein
MGGNPAPCLNNTKGNTMQKSKRINTPYVGQIVAVNNCDDGQLYRLAEKHPFNNSVYLLTYLYDDGTEVSGGWLDKSCFLEPIEAQICQEYNQLFYK